MRVELLAAGLLISLTTGVHAQQTRQQPQAMHDKAFYAQHDAVRAATLKLCVSDESYAHLYDCRNAADGENMVRAARLFRLSRPDAMADPSWWRNNGFARRGAVAICSNGTGAAYPQFAPYCSLIFASELDARN
jgi:hypothetical protein